jgi:hypothetical protein
MKLRIIAGALALALSVSPALAQTNQGTSPLTGSKGGTNNAFMQFTGPATSIKTFTLPNATDTIATLGAIQTFSAAKTFNSLVLAGAVSGGGNQINNVIIGASSPLAITGTTVTANTSVTAPIYAALSALQFQSNGSTHAGHIDTSQRWIMGTNVNAGASNAAVLTISSNAANTAALPFSGAGLQIVGVDNLRNYILMNSYGVFGGVGVPNGFGAYAARGTQAAPSALSSGDTIFNFLGTGYGTTAFGGFGNTFALVAAENFTDTAQGTYWAFNTNTIGTVSSAERMKIQAGVTIGTPTGGDKGAGSINVSGAFYANGIAVSGTGTVTSVTCGTGLTGGTITGSGTCATDYATKSDQQTGTATAKTVNPAHQQDHPSAAKAWVYALNTTAIQSGYNVSSVTRTGTGAYTINFTTPFTSLPSCVVSSVDGGLAASSQIGTLATGSVSVLFRNISTSATADPVGMTVHCNGAQ